MSIQTEITRLQGLKNTLRTKLVVLGLVQSGADLEDCVAAVDAVEYRGAAEWTISAVDGGYTIQAGYHNGSGKVSIAAAEKLKLIAGNIKSGVTILGVVGSYIGEALKAQAKSVTPTKSKQTRRYHPLGGRQRDAFGQEQRPVFFVHYASPVG